VGRKVYVVVEWSCGVQLSRSCTSISRGSQGLAHVVGGDDHLSGQERFK
jgi:hypothetical protein